MLKRKEVPIVKRSDATEELIALNEWVWQSHYWIETHPGYYVCEWCSAAWTSTFALDHTVRICLKNPRILKLLEGRGFGMRIAIVSGGFDPVHIGHVRLMKMARGMADSLFVILNSDRFLKEKKGYVFMPYYERKELLAHIAGVGLVVDCIDEDLTVCKTLEWIREKYPEAELIFCNGGDRKEENVPENAVCEKLRIHQAWNVGGGKIQSSSELVAKSEKEGR
jgi:D-beta-D-heptose 7-phosphate kinase/D-beta-D-heptose 1-phosphate adenosyltransferase